MKKHTKFKVGDKVVMVKPDKIHAPSGMDCLIGKEFVIKTVKIDRADEYLPVTYRMIDLIWNFTGEGLEKVEAQMPLIFKNI